MDSLNPAWASALAGRYRVVRELGKGGSATVYLADDLKHGRRVAIKVLAGELSAAIGRERFLHEIEVAAQLVTRTSCPCSIPEWRATGSIT